MLDLDKASQDEYYETGEQDGSKVAEVFALLRSPESVPSQRGNHSRC